MVAQTAVLGQLAPSTQKVIGHARELAAQLGDDQVHSGHLLFSLMCCHELTRNVFAFPEFNVTALTILSRLVRGRTHPMTRIRKKTELGDVSTPLSPSVDKVLLGASYIQDVSHAPEITADHLLLGMLVARGHHGVVLLRNAFDLDMRLLVRSVVATVCGYTGTTAMDIEPWVVMSGSFDKVMLLEEAVFGHWRATA